MFFEPDHVEVPEKQSFTKPSLELAQKLLLEVCVNDTSVMPQDECNKTILDKVLEPVHDPNLQVHKNMSCAPMEVHNEQQLLLQKSFLNSCQIGVEDLPSDVLPEPLPCVSKLQKQCFTSVYPQTIS